MQWSKNVSFSSVKKEWLLVALIIFAQFVGFDQLVIIGNSLIFSKTLSFRGRKNAELLNDNILNVFMSWKQGHIIWQSLLFTKHG